MQEKNGKNLVAEVVCLYCGRVTGKKLVNVPEFIEIIGKPVTHGICRECLLKLYLQLPESEKESAKDDENSQITMREV